MRYLFLIAYFIALSMARPELYKEKEDFQFSRSSSDDGKKSGFYGAQRGNMGGNYEKAHNMDILAQSQMSGLVKQVHGELGEAANTRTGNVYGAASTKGIYGQGHSDLSSLAGRNFNEGVNYGDSSSSAYRAHSGSSASKSSDGLSSYILQNANANEQTRNSQQYEDVHESSSNSNYRKSYGHSSGYNSESAYGGQSQYDSSGQHRLSSDNALATGDGYKVVHYKPTRVVLRPGTKVNVPFTAQTADEFSASDRFDENNINNDRNTAGSNKAKHFESSYNYRKEWEKHDTLPMPLGIPTQDSTANAHVNLENSNSLASNSRYSQNSNYQANENSRRQFSNKYNQEESQSQIGGSSSQALNGLEHNNDNKAKHYESSYSYHKEWEKHNTSPSSASLSTQFSGRDQNAEEGRYGSRSYNSRVADNSHYNIGSRGSQERLSSNYDQQESQNQFRLHSQTHNQNEEIASSAVSNLHQEGIDASTSFGTALSDIEKSLGSKAAPKRYESSYSYHKSWERQGDPYVILPDGTYKTQRLTDGSADISSNQHGTKQRSQRFSSSQVCGYCDENGHYRKVRSVPNQQWETPSYTNYELIKPDNFDQQSQAWEDVGQQTQISENFKDLSQQSQTNWENLGQQTQVLSENLEDLGQQTQNNWENLGQETQSNWENLGQETQSNWANLGQQTQNNWENLQQQSQNGWENTQLSENSLSNFEQQSHDPWNKLSKLQSDFGQQTQDNWSNLETLAKIQDGSNSQVLEQQVQKFK